jgi:hypothetical protein
MSFHMDVRVDKVFEEGAYWAVLEDVEEKETKFGERLMWTFRLLDENGEVVGFTSMSPSTKANAYRWAEAIMGAIGIPPLARTRSPYATLASPILSSSKSAGLM